jgi:hypothetical protein
MGLKIKLKKLHKNAKKIERALGGLILPRAHVCAAYNPVTTVEEAALALISYANAKNRTRNSLAACRPYVAAVRLVQ